MFNYPDAQLDAEENAGGEHPIWRRVYAMMRCDSSACHYRLHTQTLKKLVAYAKKGGVLESHKDIPDEIQEQLQYTWRSNRDWRKKSAKGVTAFSWFGI
jgi:hypothetical protein